tara:strand:+ start:338 stop:556 length:219 start_codon:yes stop_codon:yes gene_type:complete
MKPGDTITLFNDWGTGLVILDFTLQKKAYEFNGKTYYHFIAKCKTPFSSYLTEEQIKQATASKTVDVKELTL